MERLRKISDGFFKPEVFLGLGILFLVGAEITAIGSNNMTYGLVSSLPLTAAGLAFIIGSAILKKNN